MTKIFTLLAVASVATMVGMSSCSSSRSAQTTDDIYYSSGGRKAAAAAEDEGSEYYSTKPNDNYVRMKAQDPAKWSYFDDYNAYDSYCAPVGAGMSYGGYYGYPAYGYGMGMGMGYGYPAYSLGFGFGYSMWDSYFLWNSWYNPYFYNPYYGGAVFVSGHQATPSAVYTNLRPFNSVAYRNGLGHTTQTTPTGTSRYYRPGMSTSSNYNNALSGQGRPVNNTFYHPANANSNGGYRPAPSFSQPTRSYSPPMGGGGGGGFSRPGHH